VEKIITVEGAPVIVRLKEVDHSRTQRLLPKNRKAFDYGIKRLSGRQRETLANIMKAGAVDAATKRQAAIEAGYAPAYALQAADTVLQRREIVELLEKHGVTQDKIARVIAEGLEAMHPLTEVPKPDHHARHKFVQEANRIHGNYAPTKIKGDFQGRVVHLHLTAEDFKAGEKYEQMREDGA